MSESPRRESNPHALRRRRLKTVRLPVSPLGEVEEEKRRRAAQEIRTPTSCLRNRRSSIDTRTALTFCSTSPSIQRSVCRGEAVAVGAEKFKILGSMIVGIAIAVVDGDWNFSGFGIYFRPSALPATGSSLRDEPVASEGVEPFPRSAFAFTSQPSMKSISFTRSCYGPDAFG